MPEKKPPLHLTAAQYREYTATGRLPEPAAKSPSPEIEARRVAPGSVRNGEGQNKLEAAYALYLEHLKRAGVVKDYKFESITLRLANRTRYTPDFYVELPDGQIEFHETKGFMREDANVKLKVAASLYPSFVFRLVKRKAGAWEITEVRK